MYLLGEHTSKEKIYVYNSTSSSGKVLSLHKTESHTKTHNTIQNKNVKTVDM